MVFRYKGLSHDGQEHASRNPAEKDVQGIEGFQTAGIQIFSFILIIDCCSYVNGVEQFVKQIDGVESVKGDGNYIKLEVTGKVDPFKIQEMVKHETKKKVELQFPLSEMKGARNEKKGTETKVKKRIMPMDENDIGNEKAEESILVLKIKLCCDSCNQKLERFLNIKGLEMLTMDREKEQITVRGTVDVTKLRSSIKDKFKKDVEVVNTIAVMFPAKKDDNIINKKDESKCGGVMTKSTMVAVKMKLHCDGCIGKIRRIISKMKGVENISIYAENDLIVVKGTMNVEELTSYLKEKIKSNVEVVPINKEINWEDKENNLSSFIEFKRNDRQVFRDL